MRAVLVVVCLFMACEKRARQAEPSPVRVAAPIPVVLVVTDAAVPPPPVDAALDLMAPLPGERDAASIKATVQRSGPAMRRCYQDQLKSQPDLAGKVTLHITIAADGQVSQVKASGGLDAELEECMMAVARRLRFALAASETRVNFPFVFKSAP